MGRWQPSRQTWFVVANSKTDGTIARANHKSIVPSDGAAASVPPSACPCRSPCPPRRAMLTAQAAHKTAKTAKLHDHRYAKTRVAKIQSKTAGKETSANNEPALESAYSR